jgi:dTDP-4-dehydrorhamnose reductase
MLLTGASGQLGSYLLRELQLQRRDVRAWSGSPRAELFGTPLSAVDLTDPDMVVSAFRAASPAVILHAAACSTIAQCHQDPQGARRLNVEATDLLVELASTARSRLVLVSTDLVFDGRQGWYREHDSTAPLSVYGQTKRAAEQLVLQYERGAVVRLSLLFGPSLSRRKSFFEEQLSALREGRPCRLFEDEWRTPLTHATAAAGLIAVAESDLVGLLHMGGPERLSRLEMGRRLAAFCRCDPGVLEPARRADVPAPEPRPRDVSLDSSRWRSLFPNQPWPTLDEALKQTVV